MAFLPDPSVLASFSLACFVLFITPGPDMSLFLAKTLQGGRMAGIAAMSGALTGCLIHTLAAAIGLSALIAASSAAFTAVKIVGAVYLLWLAFAAIRSGSTLDLASESRPAGGFRRTFLIGLGINLTNPKIILFFLTFLPQFIAASDPHASQKLLFLGLYFVAFSTPLAILLILAAERVIGALRSNPKLLRGLDFLFAGVFAAFAVQILRTEAR